MNDNKSILCLFAHPDDVEFLCAGTLALLHEEGWNIHIATLTAGDCGSNNRSRQEIAAIRRGEAEKAATLVDATYYCLDFDDMFISYDRDTLTKAIGLIRKIQPSVVFAPSPFDYAMDHEVTSRIAQSACFGCGIQNISIAGIEPFEPTPYLYYTDPVEGKDRFGNVIRSTNIVDISAVYKTKEEMLCCHESQREWLRAHHGMDEYVQLMKRTAQNKGCEIGVDFAEGLTQHLGHAFPAENILKKILSEYVHTMNSHD